MGFAFEMGSRDSVSVAAEHSECDIKIWPVFAYHRGAAFLGFKILFLQLILLVVENRNLANNIIENTIFSVEHSF